MRRFPWCYSSCYACSKAVYKVVIYYLLGLESGPSQMMLLISLAGSSLNLFGVISGIPFSHFMYIPLQSPPFVLYLCMWIIVDFLICYVSNEFLIVLEEKLMSLAFFDFCSTIESDLGGAPFGYVSFIFYSFLTFTKTQRGLFTTGPSVHSFLPFLHHSYSS